MQRAAPEGIHWAPTPPVARPRSDHRFVSRDRVLTTRTPGCSARLGSRRTGGVALGAGFVQELLLQLGSRPMRHRLPRVAPQLLACHRWGSAPGYLRASKALRSPVLRCRHQAHHRSLRMVLRCDPAHGTCHLTAAKRDSRPNPREHSPDLRCRRKQRSG